MVMFILIKFKPNKVNYPKYLIILGTYGIAVMENISLYYLVSNVKYINFYRPLSKYLTYLVNNLLYFKLMDINSDKFKISKLGTDFIVNELCIHFKDECIGRYPENYVFVNEPDWPIYLRHRTDRTPLKRKYH